MVEGLLIVHLPAGFSDFLPEELRLEYYNCRANNNTQNYVSPYLFSMNVYTWHEVLFEKIYI